MKKYLNVVGAVTFLAVLYAMGLYAVNVGYAEASNYISKAYGYNINK